MVNLTEGHHKIPRMAFIICNNVCQKFRVLSNTVNVRPKSFLSFPIDVLVLN